MSNRPNTYHSVPGLASLMTFLVALSCCELLQGQANNPEIMNIHKVKPNKIGHCMRYEATCAL